jgi:hypothetical protein
MDMWNGYLGFFTKLSDGDWSAWWGQHNEHRIFLARLFFWFDLFEIDAATKIFVRVEEIVDGCERR